MGDPAQVIPFQTMERRRKVRRRAERSEKERVWALWDRLRPVDRERMEYVIKTLVEG